MQETPKSSPSYPDEATAPATSPPLASSHHGANRLSPTAATPKSSTKQPPSERQVSRKGRACLTCRKLKVKCSGLERGERGCQRCQRLGLDCKIIKKLRLNLEDGGRSDTPLTRLDRSVRAILAKLDMPPLESFAPAPPPSSKTTRDNSRETSREPESKAGQYDIAGAPMEGLYEATHLSALRSRSAGQPTQRRLRKNFESDLISQGVISVREAERMLTLFKTSLSRYLYNAAISEDCTLQSVRESSSLSFTAIMAVSSLHIPGMEEIHNACHRQLRDLIASSMFDRSHTLEDIRALCIAAFWLPDLSWKLSGHCVRMATELNLHQAFFKAFHSPVHISPEERDNTLERARLWYLLYVLDHHFSIAYGRPPATSEMQAIRETDLFLQSPECTMSDRRVISQVALFRILSKAYNAFGLEAGRLLEGDDETLIIHARFIEDLNHYREQFRPLLQIDPYVGMYSVMGIELHYHFNSMMLNSLALRGRSMAAIAALPHRLRPLAFHAIESAHRILEFVLGEPDLRRSLVGVPLYLHAMIAFAVVFLIKMSAIWESIGVSIDPQTRTRPLLEGIITTMQECKAGAHHILYKMATGFERMLRRSSEPTKDDDHARPAPAIAPLSQHHHPNSNPADLAATTPNSQTPHSHHQQPMDFIPDPQHPSADVAGGGAYPFDTYGVAAAHQANLASAPSTAWPPALTVEDDMFWSMVGTEYDLLANAPDANVGFYTFHDMGPLR